MHQPPKAIRAKLGEASSFYYDPELKRWINKKGGDTAPTPTATPPPPKAGPPRTVSGTPSLSGGPPTSAPRSVSGGSTSDPPQRSVSDMVHPTQPSQSDGSMGPPDSLAPPFMARSVSNGSSTGPMGSPKISTGPPSRPGTAMSNASSIDDLLGPALPRKGGKAAVKGKKKGRGYIDVMGDKAAAT